MQTVCGRINRSNSEQPQTAVPSGTAVSCFSGADCYNCPIDLYGARRKTVFILTAGITRSRENFYGFARGGFWYVSLIAMYLLGTLLSILMARLQRKTAPSEK